MAILRDLLLSILLLGASATEQVAAAQSPEDRVDPAMFQDRPDDRREPVAAPNSAPLIETGTAQTMDLGEALVVGAIRVEGATVLAPADFAAVTDSYVGRPLMPEELRALASDIAAVARREGYGLASAWIPPQRISNGVLRVRLDEGRIDEVDASGNGAAAVERILRPLADGRPVRTAELERRLLIAGDLAGIRVGRARLQRVGGRNRLMVKTARTAGYARAYLDNWGTKEVGPVRARIAVDLNGLLSTDDRLSLGGTVTTMDPSEFRLANASYQKGVGKAGTTIEVNGWIARSQPGGALEGRNIAGKSAFVGVEASHPLIRSRDKSLWANFGLSLLDSRQTRNGVETRDDRITSAEASLYGTTGDANGRLRARLAARQGLDLFSASEAGQPRLSRPDGSGRFTKVEFWAAYDRKLGSGFGLALQAQGQIASRPLLSSEEMGLGGRYFLRGYDYREYSGDKGIAGSAELRFDLKQHIGPVENTQLYVFADAGSVGNYEDGFGSGSLASAGVGARLDLGKKFELGLELGIPLRDGAIADKDYSPRFSFTLAARF